MSQVSFTVSGDPVPQPRPRVSTVGGFARAYVPKDHPVHAYRFAVQMAAAHAGLRKTEAMLAVRIACTFARPVSHLTKRGVRPSAPRLPRPDVDNLAKAVLDALGNFFDDTQVQSLAVSKTYGDESCTQVQISFAT